VLVPFSQGDGTCEYCRNGNSHLCDIPMLPGVSYWGGYGSYVAIPFADLNLVRMPESVGFLEGASMGCRFMTAFRGIVERARVRPGEWVAVYGCGGIGLSAVQISAAIGANVVAIDLDSRKLELADAVGANHVVNARKSDAVQAVLDITHGGAHVAVDALGIAITCRNAVMSLRKQGRALQIGLTTQVEKGEVSLPVDRMVLMELQLLGTIGMQPTRYQEMLQMVEAKKLDPRKLITDIIPLESASKVIEGMASFQNVGVSVIDFSI